MQFVETMRVLNHVKPNVIFVQNPPLFAPLTALLYSKLYDVRLILDSHTGVFLERKWRWLQFLHKYLVKRSAVSIVTNDYLGKKIESWGGKYFVFPDVPVEVSRKTKINNSSTNTVLVVNSFSYDEPLEEVVKAARHMSQVSFAITGDVARCPAKLLQSIPDNVEFTGFVSREEYINRLFSADVAVVLTTEDYTMQRGAYEAMSLGTPIITSDWPILKNTFFRGALHVDNTAESLVKALNEVLSNKAYFDSEVRKLKKERRRIWAEKLEQFSREFLSDELTRAK
jgi:glycosyltransferase involved in cell wall biosynthesis